MDRFKDWLNELNIDFVKRRYLFGSISGAMVLLSWFLFLFGSSFGFGPKWGIDFTGGTELQLKFAESVEITEIRDTLGKLGLSEDSVQQIGKSDEHLFKIRIQDPNFGADAARQELTQRLETSFGKEWVKETRFDNEVGARLVVQYNGEIVPPATVAEKFSDIVGVSVQAGRDDHEVVIQLPGLSRQIEAEIHKAVDRDFEVLSVDAVGPRVGADLRQQAFFALFAALGLVLIYTAFRFDFSFAPGAIIALFHDVSVTIGIWVLLQKDFTLSLIGALLTIVGYSLNDTIVIYDRIRENRNKHRRQSLVDLINLSVNETLTRTITTSFNTMMAILPFLILGGAVVEDFALAMVCGIIFGSYSTIFIASPMIFIMEDLKPYFQRLIVSSGLAASKSAAVSEDPSAPQTESERRRLERLEREKAEQGRLR